MTTFDIYPAIDLRNGKVVRLKYGDPAQQTVFGDDPAAMGAQWVAAGSRWLHVVNLDGAFDEAGTANWQALPTLTKLGAKVQFGGGIRSMDAIADVLKLGVSRAILGTIAIEQPDIVRDALTSFGADHVAVGIDARDGLVRTRGWKDNSGVPALDLALQMQTFGLATVIFTDVSRDGLGSGLNIPSTRELAESSGLDVIASGGVHTIEDVKAAKDAGLAGCIIGRALYDGTVDLREALQV